MRQIAFWISLAACSCVGTGPDPWSSEKCESWAKLCQADDADCRRFGISCAAARTCWDSYSTNGC